MKVVLILCFVLKILVSMFLLRLEQTCSTFFKEKDLEQLYEIGRDGEAIMSLPALATQGQVYYLLSEHLVHCVFLD